MKVMVTGGCGNIGGNAVAELLRHGHRVRCFDVDSPANRRVAARFPRGVQMVWGDLRNPPEVQEAVSGQEAVVHLAFVIPRLSATGVSCEDEPDWAREINVGGTRNLLEAMKRQSPQPRILFASSLHIYGITRDQEPPLKVGQPPRPIEHYSRHKVECEALVREAGLSWCIFRLAAALPFSLRLDGGMFEVPLDNRMEFVHHRDVALAVARAVDDPRVWGRVLHIGGGPACQYTYGQIVETVMEAVGLSMLPAEAFTRRPFSTDWLDTAESQGLLGFQRFTLEDYARELARRLGARRLLVKALRPLARRLLLARSPYYRAGRLRSAADGLRGGVALVTCPGNSFGEAIARKLAGEGLQVILAQRPGESLEPLLYQIAQEGGRVQALAAELSSERELEGLCRRVLDSYGRVDVLVNHADLEWAGLEERPGGDPWRTLEGSTLGTVRLTQLLLEHMRARGRGRIVFVEPALKLLPARPTAYLRAVRSFFRTYTAQLARELAGAPVGVSLVRSGVSTAELLKLAPLRSLLRGRSRRVEVRPEELAHRVWWLVVRPRPVVYVPQLMMLFSWMERYAGWALDLLRRRLFLARQPAR